RSSRNERPSLPGITTSEKMRSKLSAFARSSARLALSQTVASCPARRKAREREARVLASSSTISKLAFRGKRFSSNVRSLGSRQFIAIRGQIDDKGCAVALLAMHADSAAVVTDNRLYDCQAESRATHFAGVIRRKEPRALVRSKSLAGVRYFD